MAEEQGFDKSELPSQRRREEARAQGQLAYSHELITGLLLLASAYGLSWGGAALAQGLTDELHRHISRPHLEYSIDEASSLIAGLCGRGLTLVGGMIRP